MPTFTPVDDDPFSPSPTPAPAPSSASAPSTAMPKASAAPALVPVDHDPFATGETSAPLASPAAGVGSAMPSDAASGEVSAMPSVGVPQPTSALPASSVDTALPPAEPAPSRGYTTELLAGAKKAPFDIITQVANAAATLSPQGSEAEIMANKAVDWAQEKRREFAPESVESQKGGLEGFAHRGVSEILPATATSYATAALPSAAVVAGIKSVGWGMGPVGKLIAHGIASGVGGVSFGLSQYNETYRNLREKFTSDQMSDDDIKAAALKTAVWEGAGETVANFFLLKLLGTFGKSLVKEGTKAAEKSVVGLLKPGAKELVRQGVREGLPVLGTEVGTEIMQNVAETDVQREAARQAGWSEEKIDKEFGTLASAGAEAIIPTVGMTIISALLGGGRAHLKNKAALINLQNTEADPKERAKSLEYVLQGLLENEQKPYAKAFKAAKAEGASDADAHAAALDIAVPGVSKWFKDADSRIATGQPIDVNQRLGDFSKTPQGSTKATDEPTSAVPDQSAPSDQNIDLNTGQAIPKRSAADKAWDSALGDTALPTPEPLGPTPGHVIDLTDYQPTSGPTQALKEGYMQSRQEAAQGASAEEPRSIREQNARAQAILDQVLQELDKGGDADAILAQAERHFDQPETALPAKGLPGTEPPAAALPVAPKPTPQVPPSPAGAMEAIPPVDQGAKAPESPTAPGINLPEAQAGQILSALPDIGRKAHEAATSPLNALPQPSDAQKAADVYKKGNISVQGLEIAIENPKGSIRTSKPDAEKPWATQMKSHYGFIRGTVAADSSKTKKQGIDVFIGPNTESQKVYVVDQIDPKTGKFDEHKAIIGRDSMNDARIAYLENYELGWQGMGAITEMTMPEFKAWLKSGNTKKALAYTESKGKKALPGLPEEPIKITSIPETHTLKNGENARTAYAKLAEKLESAKDLLKCLKAA